MQPRQAVAVAFTTQALAIGTTIGPISLFMRPIATELDSSLAAVGSGASLIFMMMAVSGMVNGRFLDRGHTRRVMLIGASVLCLALLTASRATSLWQLAACAIAMGTCIPMLGPLSGSTLVGRVVTEGRGRALGIMNIGAPVGSVVFVLLAGVLIENVGWRDTLAVFSGAVGTIVIPTIARWVPRLIASPATAESTPGFEPRELIRTADFRWLAATQGIVAGMAMGWAVHVAPYLQGLGASIPASSAVIATGSGVGILGGVTFGMLVDRRSARGVMTGILVCNIAGFLMLSSEPMLALAIVSAVAIGFLGGGIMPVYTTLLAQRFGPESLGRAFGLTNLFMLPLGFGLPPLAGLAMESFGSYAPALWGMVSLYVLAVGFLSRVKGPFNR